ncbi:MAG: hypothetical protein WAO98_10200 [Alphaproteobacteria bacterium]
MTDSQNHHTLSYTRTAKPRLLTISPKFRKQELDGYCLFFAEQDLGSVSIAGHKGPFNVHVEIAPYSRGERTIKLIFKDAAREVVASESLHDGLLVEHIRAYQQMISVYHHVADGATAAIEGQVSKVRSIVNAGGTQRLKAILKPDIRMTDAAARNIVAVIALNYG